MNLYVIGVDDNNEEFSLEVNRYIHIHRDRYSKKIVADIDLRESNYLNIEDWLVSRKHLEIKLIKDKYYAKDLGSKFGTYINGMLIDGWAPYSESKYVEIKEGTLVTLAYKTKFRIEFDKEVTTLLAGSINKLPIKKIRKLPNEIIEQKLEGVSIGYIVIKEDLDESLYDVGDKIIKIVPIRPVSGKSDLKQILYRNRILQIQNILLEPYGGIKWSDKLQEDVVEKLKLSFEIILTHNKFKEILVELDEKYNKNYLDTMKLYLDNIKRFKNSFVEIEKKKIAEFIENLVNTLKYITE